MAVGVIVLKADIQITRLLGTFRHIAVVAIKSPAWEYTGIKDWHITLLVAAKSSTVMVITRIKYL
jgi:hypothetical protein